VDRDDCVATVREEPEQFSEFARTITVAADTAQHAAVKRVLRDGVRDRISNEQRRVRELGTNDLTERHGIVRCFVGEADARCELTCNEATSQRADADNVRSAVHPALVRDLVRHRIVAVSAHDMFGVA
ncbi:MAG: hypothetical protein H3C62_06420, partial [Gemmatimonadaceae bacterium]|nr:hypothetical protein [Gemmatimonadaceae bacterium]